MTRAQVIKKKTSFEKKLKRLTKEIEGVRRDWNELQHECAHPNIVRGGTDCSHCPDCGWS